MANPPTPPPEIRPYDPGLLTVGWFPLMTPAIQALGYGAGGGWLMSHELTNNNSSLRDRRTCLRRAPHQHRPVIS